MKTYQVCSRIVLQVTTNSESHIGPKHAAGKVSAWLPELIIRSIEKDVRDSDVSDMEVVSVRLLPDGTLADI